MARKNKRQQDFVPLDLTPTDLDKQPVTRAEREQREARRRESDWDRARRQREARVNKGIDWSSCVIPGCGRLLSSHGFRPTLERRDASLDLPMCFDHAAVVWRTMLTNHANDPALAEAIADLNARVAERERREHEEAKASRKANVTRGDIYFIRLGELVKVGWTRDLWSRVKSYGAAAELLVTYPASRDDETNLHRQLSPARAKGREWYHDGDIIARFIDDALAKYGMPPTFDGMWTQPKQVVAGKRAMCYR